MSGLLSTQPILGHVFRRYSYIFVVDARECFKSWLGKIVKYNHTTDFRKFREVIGPKITLKYSIFIRVDEYNSKGTEAKSWIQNTSFATFFHTFYQIITCVCLEDYSAMFSELEASNSYSSGLAWYSNVG